MNHTGQDVLRRLRSRLTARSNRSRVTSTGHPFARGDYRSSRDTAASRLRGADAELLGLTGRPRRPNATLVDYYARS
ncbi:hypothetical protein [Couchioplanes caeruleus]|uniref:Uncharacterized protein n=2 Tax=Couchioplanes caeruleus TaxID=56438 RepID=A0A1K0GU54_9ACTN|nr:hypothetical protein [Couchioplanes caeruleus]OJF16014.1 hypothetical protein BG844_01935 [Couchioplanes caeruleus subsp. caeruleus]ROP27872.1 hypothetical protein EDD30_0567 [Couchioplanes caeruleus]